MAEKKKKEPSQRQSETKEDQKSQDLSPFRVVFVGATLSECSTHGFASFSTNKPHSLISFHQSFLVWLVSIQYLVLLLLMPEEIHL